MGCGTSGKLADNLDDYVKDISDQDEKESKPKGKNKNKKKHSNWRNNENAEKETMKNVKQRRGKSKKKNRDSNENENENDNDNENEEESFNTSNNKKHNVKQKLNQPSIRVKELKQRKRKKQKESNDNHHLKNFITPFDNEEAISESINNSRLVVGNEYEEIHSKFANEIKLLNLKNIGEPKERDEFYKNPQDYEKKKRNNFLQNNEIEPDINYLEYNQNDQFNSRKNEKGINEKRITKDNKVCQNQQRKESTNEININHYENGYNKNTNESANNNNNNELAQKTCIDPIQDKHSEKNNLLPIKKNDSLREMNAPPTKVNNFKLIPLNYEEKEDENIFIHDSPFTNAFTTDNRGSAKNHLSNLPIIKTNFGSAHNKCFDNSKSKPTEEKIIFLGKNPINPQKNLDSSKKYDLNDKKCDHCQKYSDTLENLKQNNQINQANSVNTSKTQLNSKNELKEKNGGKLNSLETKFKEELLLTNSENLKSCEMIDEILKNSLNNSPDDTTKRKVNLNIITDLNKINKNKGNKNSKELLSKNNDNLVDLIEEIDEYREVQNNNPVSINKYLEKGSKFSNVDQQKDADLLSQEKDILNNGFKEIPKINNPNKISPDIQVIKDRQNSIENNKNKNLNNNNNTEYSNSKIINRLIKNANNSTLPKSDMPLQPPSIEEKQNDEDKAIYEKYKKITPSQNNSNDIKGLKKNINTIEELIEDISNARIQKIEVKSSIQDNPRIALMDSKLTDGNPIINSNKRDYTSEINKEPSQINQSQNNINNYNNNKAELSIMAKFINPNASDVKPIITSNIQMGKLNNDLLSTNQIKAKLSNEEQKVPTLNANRQNFPSLIITSINEKNLITLNSAKVQTEKKSENENLILNQNKLTNKLNLDEEEEDLEESSVESHDEEVKEPEKTRKEMILEKLKNINYSNISLQDHYLKMEKIGEGTYGVVYRAKDNNTNEIIALKKIKIENDQITKVAIREIGVLIKATHPNVVKLKEVVCAENDLSLIFEYCDYDLQIFLNKFRMLGAKVVKSFMFQLLQGLQFCHSKNILHRDIKAKNLLIDKNMKLKICDFGLAREFDSNTREFTHEVITRWYRPPEILLGQKEYNSSVDIWSSACLFALMAQNKHLFPGDDEIDQLHKIFKILGTPNEAIWPGVSSLPDFKNFPIYPKLQLEGIVKNIDNSGYDLLKKMLVLNPTKRITASEALSHAYFDEVRALYQK